MNTTSSTCKICQSKSEKHFTCTVLSKYEVTYYKCSHCDFIQTEDPYWLPEAYSSAITSLDIGLIHRNQEILPHVETIVKLFFDRDKKFLDYGGGYGLFVRMMRDKGFDYYRFDTYCENLFAKKFDLEDANLNGKFELLTAFEVFEHLVDPLQEFEKMAKLSDSIFFTTSLYPENTDLRNWWYLIPETGQHVSLYSRKSLELLSKKYDFHYYSFGSIYHLFTRKKISKRLFTYAFDGYFKRLLNKFRKNRPSLLTSDFNKISNTKM